MRLKNIFKLKYILVFVFVLVISIILAFSTISDTVTLTSGNITEDGHIQFTDPTYTRNNTHTTASIGNTETDIYRGYIEFNTSSIPDNAGIVNVYLNISISSAVGGENCNINPIERQVSSQTDTNLYTDIGNGTSYISNNNFCTSGGRKYINLGSSASTDLQNQLSAEWFAVGIKGNSETGSIGTISTVESANDPILIVEYDITFPLLNFTAPTPNNASSQTATNVEINISIVEPYLREVKWNWNSTNFTIYNNSLFVMYNFNNLTAVADNSTGAKDLAPDTEDNFGVFGNATSGTSPVWTSNGKYGSAVYFDGINDMIVPESPANGIWHAATSSRTFEIWLKTNSTSQNHQIIIEEGGGANGLCIMLNNSALWFYTVNNSVRNITSYPLSDTNWHYVAATYNGSLSILYLDGNLVNSTNVDFSFVTTHADEPRIGAPSGASTACNATGYFNGTLDEFKLWNRTLTTQEINQSYMSNLYKFNSTQWYFYSNQTKSPNVGLTDGTYTYFASVKDTIAQENMTETRTVTVDTIAPLVTIINPENITYTSSSIPFNFTLNEAGNCMYSLNSGAINYTMTANSSNTGFNATNASIADGSYTVNAYCNDTAGNRNDTTTRIFSKDTTAPNINLTYPLNITYNINVSALNYTVSNGQQACWYSIDSGTTNTTVTCGNNLTSLTSSEGSNTWMAAANDSSNNKNASYVTFFKDTIIPSINIVTPANNSNSSDAGLDVNYTISDANLQSCWYSNDTFTYNYSLANCANITTVTWSEGQHNVTVYANDSVNNVNSSSVRFTVDTISPQITIISPQNITYNTTSIDFNVTANEALSLCKFTLNNWIINYTMTQYNSTYFNYTNSSISDNNYTAKFWCNDTLNNINNTEQISFSIDTISPNITLNSPADSYSTTSTTITFSYNVSDAGNVTNCSLIANNIIKASNTSINKSSTNELSASFVVGTYTWHVNCTDNAGNMGNSSQRSFTISASSVPPSSSGGGGGGTLSYDFYVNQSLIKIEIKKGEVTEKVIKIKNTASTEQTFELSSSLSNFISFSENNFKLKAGEEKEINIVFFTLSTTSEGVYTGNITIKTKDKTKEIKVIFEVKSKVILFDISLEIPKKYEELHAGEEIVMHITLINMGEVEKADVTLEYIIKDFSNNTIIREEESVAVETQASFSREMNLPKDIAPGEYVLIANVKYKDSTSSSSKTFRVLEVGKRKINKIYLIWIFLVVLLSVIIIIYEIIEHKRTKKRDLKIKKKK